MNSFVSIRAPEGKDAPRPQGGAQEPSCGLKHVFSLLKHSRFRAGYSPSINIAMTAPRSAPTSTWSGV